MAWYDSLIEQGAVPAGTTPKQINPRTGVAEHGPTNTVAMMLKSLNDVMVQQQEQQAKRQEAMKKQVDMYNTLRDQGYDPKSASEAVRSSKFPTTEPGVPLKDQKTQAEIDALRGGKDTSYDRVKARILNKMSNDEALTAGEQRVYDEVIKKDTGLAGLLGGLESDGGGGGASPTPAPAPAAMVPVIAPDGRKGTIPASKLQAALKRGYKRR